MPSGELHPIFKSRTYTSWKNGKERRSSMSALGNVQVPENVIILGSSSVSALDSEEVYDDICHCSSSKLNCFLFNHGLPNITSYPKTEAKLLNLQKIFRTSHHTRSQLFLHPYFLARTLAKCYSLYSRIGIPVMVKTMFNIVNIFRINTGFEFDGFIVRFYAWLCTASRTESILISYSKYLSQITAPTYSPYTRAGSIYARFSLKRIEKSR